MQSIKKNFFYNTVYNILALIIPFITTPYISRILGPNGVGIYSYTYSVAYYFVLFTMLGLNKYANRTMAEIRDNQEAINRSFSEIYTMQFLTGMISTFVYIFFVIFVFQTNKLIFAIQLIYVISATFDVSWFFFGIERFRLTVIRNIIIRLLNVVALFVFIKEPEDVLVYCIIMAFSSLLSNIVLWPVLLNNFVKYTRPNWKCVLKHFKRNLILFIPTIAVSVYKIMDKIMLGGFIGTTEVGYYENAEKIINIPMTLVTAIGTVMLPRMTYYISMGKRKEEKYYIDITMSFAIWISCLLTSTIITIAEFFVPLFLGNDFLACIPLVYILSPTMIFISWGNTICNQILIPRKKDTVFTLIVVFGAIINCILNLFMISNFKANGVAFATLITEFIVWLGYNIAAAKYFEWYKCLISLVAYSVIGVSMMLMLENIMNIRGESIISMGVQLTVGIIYYVLCSLGITYLINRKFYNFLIGQVRGVVGGIIK